MTLTLTPMKELGIDQIGITQKENHNGHTREVLLPEFSHIHDGKQKNVEDNSMQRARRGLLQRLASTTRELNREQFVAAVEGELTQLGPRGRAVIKGIDSFLRFLDGRNIAERQKVRRDSMVVDHLTPWEYFLNTGLKHEATNVIYAIQKKEVESIDESHLGKIMVNMTDFMQSRKEFENQGFGYEFNLHAETVDKRVFHDDEKHGAARFAVIDKDGQAYMVDVDKNSYLKYKQENRLEDLAQLMKTRIGLASAKKIPFSAAQKEFKHVQFVINMLDTGKRGSVWQKIPFDSALGVLYLGKNNVPPKADGDDPAEVIGVLNHKIADGGPGIRFFLDTITDALPDKAAMPDRAQAEGRQNKVKLLTPEGEKKPIFAVEIPADKGAVHTLFETFAQTLDDKEELGPGVKTILVPVASRDSRGEADMESRVNVSAVPTEINGKPIDKEKLKDYLAEAASGGGYLSGVFTTLFANDRMPFWAKQLALPVMKVVRPKIAEVSEGNATLTKAIHRVYTQEDYDRLQTPSFTTLNPTSNVDRVTLAVTEVQLVDKQNPHKVLARKYSATVTGGGKYMGEDNLRRFAQKFQDKMQGLMQKAVPPMPHAMAAAA